jgi:hypothetical protein
MNQRNFHARQAITVRYHGPDTARGLEPRWTATSAGGNRCTVEQVDSADSTPEQHAARAALALAKRLNWDEYNRYHVGGTRDGYVFVAATPDTFAFGKVPRRVRA